MTPTADGPRGCLGCGHPLPEPFLDLGEMPLANAYLKPGTVFEPTHTLAVACCPDCHLVQLTELVSPEELFCEYLYFSSFSDVFLKHAEGMADHLIDRFNLGDDSFVLEIASNDGYLLQYFMNADVPVLGVEPAANIAEVAEAKGIPTLNAFFSSQSVGDIRAKHGAADLIIGNNVLAHVPTINDFLAGIANALKPTGVAVLEFPYLLNLLERTEFDTIYHEHVFYYSVSAINGLFKRAGMELFDIEEFSIHGGSLRVFGQIPGERPVASTVHEMLAREDKLQLTSPKAYADFAARAKQLKDDLVALVGKLKGEGRRVAAYGAPAKGNTLLNYCGLGTDMIDFTVDRSPYKQGLLTPGMRIPIYPPEKLLEERPDYTLILPWNIADEIIGQQAEYRRRGGRFIVPVPRPEVVA